MAHGRRPSICHIVPGLDLVPGSASTRQTLALARSLAAHAEVTVAFRRVTGPVAPEPFDIVALEPNGHERSSDLPASRRALGRFIDERCSAHGTVLEANLMLDRASGRPRGFGFVTMSTPEEAQKAIDAMNGTALDGRNLTVNLARPREERAPSGGGGGGGGGSRRPFRSGQGGRGRY